MGDKSTDDFHTYGSGYVDPDDAARWNRGYSDIGGGMVQCWETGAILPRAAFKSTTNR